MNHSERIPHASRARFSGGDISCRNICEAGTKFDVSPHSLIIRLLIHCELVHETRYADTF